MFPRRLPTYTVSAEQSALVLRHAHCAFTLAASQASSLSQSKQVGMHLGVVFFMFLTRGVHELSWCSVFLSTLQNFLLFKRIFFLFLSLDSVTIFHIRGATGRYPTVPGCSVYSSQSPFSLYISFWIVSITMSSSQRIFSSTASHLSLVSFSPFFSSDVVFLSLDL